MLLKQIPTPPWMRTQPVMFFFSAGFSPHVKYLRSRGVFTIVAGRFPRRKGRQSTHRDPYALETARLPSSADVAVVLAGRFPKSEGPPTSVGNDDSGQLCSSATVAFQEGPSIPSILTRDSRESCGIVHIMCMEHGNFLHV